MKLLGNIPKKVYLACSGGKDSMMMLHFLLQGRRDVHVLYYNHGTKHGKEAEHFIHEFCKKNNLHLDIGTYFGKDQTEAAWRNARYNFLSLPAARHADLQRSPACADRAARHAAAGYRHT